MCIITGDFSAEVGSTKIFARIIPKRRSQIIVYQMDVNSKNDVAMILPIPTTFVSGNKVSFIDMSDRPDFFKELDAIFPKPQMLRSSGYTLRGDEFEYLQVHQVGSYKASVVPSHNDWHRLDPRFHIPSHDWKKRPIYDDGYSFVVFQLSTKKDTQNTIHPMAFEFFTRMPEDIFFPTVHYHDGYFHHKDEFDHTLYYQDDSRCLDGNFSTVSSGTYKADVPLEMLNIEQHQVLNLKQPAYKLNIGGLQLNKDIKLERNIF